MDDKRQVWRLALEEAIAERERIDSVISFYSEKLGRDPASTAAAADQMTDTAQPAPPGASPLILVSEGEFWGMSTPKATAALLDKSGRTRPLKTREILQCLRKGGVNFGGKNPEGTLYRSLGRDPRFTNVGKSTWGLSAWYPKAARTTPPSSANGLDHEVGTPAETPVSAQTDDHNDESPHSEGEGGGS